MRIGTQLFRLLLVALLIFAVSGLPVAEAKQPDNKGNSSHKGGGNKNNGKGNSSVSKGNNNDVDLADVLVTAGITLLDARNIALGQGLTNYSALPPGIQKNLMRGKPLPPGIAKKMVPGGMLSKLPVHPGYEWRVAGRDLILVSIATGMLADVLSGVFD